MYSSAEGKRAERVASSTTVASTGPIGTEGFRSLKSVVGGTLVTVKRTFVSEAGRLTR
ncbi:hypothetical protein MTQ17_10390 [Corynebacterium bovis]|uniref:hypothetical protein n=1 Tax=Corynebacterium bovis TaxID=36808 RepID=UPI00163A9CD0|nr:hypothetical protein [Corynebacterium bovis]